MNPNDTNPTDPKLDEQVRRGPLPFAESDKPTPPPPPTDVTGPDLPAKEEVKAFEAKASTDTGVGDIPKTEVKEHESTVTSETTFATTTPGTEVTETKTTEVKLETPKKKTNRAIVGAVIGLMVLILGGLFAVGAQNYLETGRFDIRPRASYDCGNQGQACCDPFSNQGLICSGNLYCSDGTCQITASSNICSSGEGEGGSPGGDCAVYKCGSQCNNGNQCNQGRTVAPCSSASLDGQCGQIDYLNGSGGYCGVKSQNCGGSCAGGTSTGGGSSGGGGDSDGGGGVTTGICINTKLYYNDGTNWVVATPAQIAANVSAGEQIRIAVGSAGSFSSNQVNNNSTSARFRLKIDNAAYGNWVSSSTKNSTGEYYINYNIPDTGGTFEVQAQILVSDQVLDQLQ